MTRNMQLICRPIERWPRDFTSPRRRSPFSAAWSSTERALRHELNDLDADMCILQLAFAERDFSVATGWPRADRRPVHPGVILAADTRHGSLKWVCDLFTEWRDNVRAIVLTLERLRLANLYGVTSRGEQYAGWKMLPGPITNAGAAMMTMEEAARFVAAVCGVSAGALMKDRAMWLNAYRDAAKRLHPDASRDPIGWRRLQDAATLLNSLHNRK